MEALDGVEDSVHRFIAADLDGGLPKETGTGYDIVIAADVLEHVRWPDKLLRDIASCLTPKGIVLASIPNFSHWYPRLRVAAGLFDYDRRGILDATHFRFFTRRSFDRLVERSGFTVNRCEPFGLPLEVFGRSGQPLTGGDETPRSRRPLATALDRVNTLSVAIRPTLFAYQYLYELAPQLAEGGNPFGEEQRLVDH